MKIGITGHKGVLGNYFIYKYKKLKFIKFQGNINNKKKIKNWILKNDISCLLHFAAIVPTKKVESNYKLAKQTNFKAVKNIVDVLKKNKKKIWFFFSSTSHVYGFSDKKFNELSKTIPVNDYGKLKLLAEKYIRTKLKNTKVIYCIGRIFSYTHFSQSRSFFIPSIFHKKLIDNNYIKKINTLRDFVDIRDICSAIKFLMNKRCRGVFNIASGKAVNLQTVLVKLNKKNKKFLINELPKNNITANINLIKKAGWNPRYNLFNILKNFKKKI